MKTTGGAWTLPAKLNPQGTQPYSVYDLVSTSTAETFDFKIETTFTNGITHLSAQITITIECGNSQTITATTTATNPTRMQHGTNNGFYLPTYEVTTYSTECPITTWQISSSNTAVVAPSGLNNPQ
jgi:hypothetical protein